ncbi:MAG: hypothetical protein AABY22_29495 [Nanoarchaeota archaeon]
MNQKNLTLYLNGKTIKIQNIKKCNEFEKIFGLMFKLKDKTNPLLFEFSKPTTMAIHSLFVFSSFLALWLDDKNQIQEIRKVDPFKLSIKPKKPFSKLVEIPLNSKYSSLVRELS